MQGILKSILFGLYLLVLGSGFAQDEVEEQRKRIVKGKIISMTVMGYKYDVDGVQDPRGIKKSTERYDKNGNITMAITYNTHGGIKEKALNKYNKKNQKIGVIKRDGADELIAKYTITYNAAGEIKEKAGEKKGLPFKEVQEFNKAGKAIKKTYFSEGIEKWHIDYSYDAQGNQVSEEYFGAQHFKTIYTYDSEGRMTSNTSYADTVQGFRYEYTYDVKGRKTREEQFDGQNNSMNVWVYSYGESPQVKHIDLYSNYLGYLKQRWTYKYDGAGNILEIKIFDSEEGLPVFTSKHIYKIAKS